MHYTEDSLNDGFRVGRWRVWPYAGRIAKGWPRKSERRVEPKAIQVLLALAATPGKFLSKDALIKKVWAGRPVSDDCVTGAIHSLRHAFGDDPRDPRYIETRNNVGYRLIADIRVNKRPGVKPVGWAALVGLAVVVGVYLAPIAVDTKPASLSPDHTHRYLQARYKLAKGDATSAEIALAGFVELTALEPQFAPAYLGKAQSLLTLFKMGARDTTALETALAAGHRFESLAGASPASNACLGQIQLLLSWDFASAEKRYRQAIAQDASNTVARRRYAWLLVAQQRYEQAKTQIQQIRLLDPLYYENAEMATLLLYAKQIDAAIVEFERLDASATLDKVVLRTMGTAYLAAGRDIDAQRVLVRMLRSSDVDEGAMMANLDAMNLAELYRHILRVNPFRSAIVAAGFNTLLGDTEQALALLDRALTDRDPYLIYLGALPELTPLRSEPRFRAILAKVGSVPANQQFASAPKHSSANPR